MTERFVFHAWVDGCVVFDLVSGDTHALDPLAAQLFLAGMGRDEMAQVVHFPRSETSNVEWGQRIEEACGRLNALGLPFKCQA